MYRARRPFFVLLAGMIASLFFQSCSVKQKVHKQLDKSFAASEIVNTYHMGFALYDLEKEQMLYSRNEDKYFVPASNTKLYTFYGGLKMLPDSIPSLRYVERGDSLIFWGTGDPSFLLKQLNGNKSYEFLKASKRKLFFAHGRYNGHFYGNGWSWDDYNDYYQAEINELPLMGNLLNLSAKDGQLHMVPRLFDACFEADSTVTTGDFRVTREFDHNVFRHPHVPVKDNYRQQVPYKINTATTLAMLSDTLQKHVELISMKMPADAKTVYNVKTDSVLKEMMLPSDNFIAEQLLLVYSNQLSQELNTKTAIKHITDTYLSELPDKPVWVDGSGLSRGNLFTPRDMIKLLQMIYKEVNNQERLFSMLPAGGQSGTLRNAYPRTDKPFVYGKTGTLSNTHNQSGYVLTKKGKIYIYAFLNNNFVQTTATVRKEMEKIVTQIHEQF
ncbi:D-alanyl-D-alanine carboxypeptidase/D-alanyl-D-alanine-endopeptidase (penicillin-binding protein 4) [Pedobacter sp. CAN_A7]|uniref:D-alanyl-D-alanine carboxypeptidase/D-alanyl-D-alanine-endopeptidase n=1 Tax=Pedobacter sp. CAN_A7 TaxID=2787722 RepID=UPI0018C9B914